MTHLFVYVNMIRHICIVTNVDLESEGMDPYASFDGFETIIVLSCTSLEITSCTYVCSVLWHVNMYNGVMFSMFYVISFCTICGTNFDAPSVHMACKDKLK
jgi:hypothetical protein